MYLCVHCVRRTHPGQEPSRHRGYVCSVLTVACGTLLLADLLTHVLTLFYSLRCQGCLESSAFNHDPSANHPGECTGVITGCLDSRSLNFYPDANTASGVCAFDGCTDSGRENYNPSANVDDGLCTPLYPGCTDSHANNYGAIYNVDDNSCKIGGCQATDTEATYDVPCLCSGTCSEREEGTTKIGVTLTLTLTLVLTLTLTLTLILTLTRCSTRHVATCLDPT